MKKTLTSALALALTAGLATVGYADPDEDSLTINGANPNSTNFVLGPGFYDVIAFNFAFIGGGAFEATFTASEIVIPLPMSLALFAPALGLLASAGFRKA